MSSAVRGFHPLWPLFRVVAFGLVNAESEMGLKDDGPAGGLAANVDRSNCVARCLAAVAALYSALRAFAASDISSGNSSLYLLSLKNPNVI
jgi:hypothetical protein